MHIIFPYLKIERVDTKATKTKTKTKHALVALLAEVEPGFKSICLNPNSVAFHYPLPYVFMQLPFKKNTLWR